jgi:hypothetical protein
MTSAPHSPSHLSSRHVVESNSSVLSAHHHLADSPRRVQDDWPNRILSQELPLLGRKLPSDAWSILAGAVSFGTTLALSTTVQKHVLGLSTGSPAPLPSLVGLASVCLASTTAHQVALATQSYVTTGVWPDDFNLWPRSQHSPSAWFYKNEQVLNLQIAQVPLHTARIWSFGILAYLCLGGRFWAVAPSSFTTAGSFARGSLPATSAYANPRQRLLVERLGRLWGCHTCGTRRLWRRQAVQFNADHIPPLAAGKALEATRWYRLLRRKVAFRFYPQCVSCSPKQGSLLSKATAGLKETRTLTGAWHHLEAAGGGSNAYNHALRPRLSHLAGGVVAAVATYQAYPADLMDGNRHRYAAWQDQATTWCRTQWETVAGKGRRRW